jgi:hypothetical protein
MVVIWGSNWYGKCDEVPRLCHVETHFFHLYYVPLIPLGSFAVFGRTPDGNVQGVPVGLSIKSVLLAWLRTILIVGGIGAAVACIINFATKHPLEGVGLGFVAACAFALFALTKKFRIFTHAGYERAIDLARRSGVTPEGMLMIEIAYGRLTAEQADMELQKLERLAEEARLEQERREREGRPPVIDVGTPAVQ